MAAGTNSIEWDFLTLLTLWNFYGLPILLAVVAIAVKFRSPSRAAGTVGFDALRTILLIGLIHYAQALRALVQLVQELLTMRAMGIPESFFNLVTCVFAVVVNPLLGRGLRRRRPRARRWAMAWYVFLSSFAIFVVFWRRRYHVAVDPTRWPDYLVSNGLPWFLLGVMHLPRIKRVFAAGRSEPLGDAGEAAGSTALPGVETTASSPPPAHWGVVSLASLLLLVIVASTLVVDVADWVSRLFLESE
jgi:hypothetical protein